MISTEDNKTLNDTIQRQYSTIERQKQGLDVAIAYFDAKKEANEQICIVS